MPTQLRELKSAFEIFSSISLEEIDQWIATYEAELHAWRTARVLKKLLSESGPNPQMIRSSVQEPAKDPLKDDTKETTSLATDVDKVAKYLIENGPMLAKHLAPKVGFPVGKLLQGHKLIFAQDPHGKWFVKSTQHPRLDRMLNIGNLLRTASAPLLPKEIAYKLQYTRQDVKSLLPKIQGARRLTGGTWTWSGASDATEKESPEDALSAAQ